MEELKENPAAKALTRNRDISLSSLISEALVIAASYRQKPRPILVIKQNLYNAQQLYDRLSTLLPESECALFGADESLRVEAIATSPEMTAVKAETMSSLLADPCQVVVTCPSALLRYLPSPDYFRKGCVSLKTGDEMDMYELKRRLQAGGYQECAHVDQPLCYAVRGGIVDVFSINYPDPVRIEFFDTEIESIRFFDIATQKTVKTADAVQIVPASDVLFSDEEIEEIREKAEQILAKENNDVLRENIENDLDLMASHIFERRMYPYMALLSKSSGIWDYMDDPQIIYSDEQLIRRSVKSFNEETIAYVQEMVQEGKMLPRYALFHDYERALSRFDSVLEDPFADNLSGIEEIHLPSETLDMRLKMIDRAVRNVFVLPEKEMLRTIDACLENNIPYTMIAEDSEVKEGISLYYGEMIQGFNIPKRGLCVYTASELFGIRHHKGRYENKFRSAEVIHSYNELDPGDYIVHAQYGVGQYVGIETRTINNVKRDFLKIIYRGNTELLVPLEQFRLVRKFVSREGVVPRLNKLGSGDWEKTRKKLEENVNDIADRLLDLYANREQHIGYAFSPDTEMNKKFEDAFPHELTPDQKKAVEEVKKDMESDKPMDRLICGDVGFGKTEVAVIASFKAVMDGKQVAVLCPTTILSSQHYRTFCDRYKGYPVNIKVLNRFVPASEVRQILKETKEGKVDILIGTHRLLSKDVKFKDLGLLVVDEEQRFGVEHKEKIKELKNSVDVLTLSATPIPRTLQMSLVGIRSLSQLETPPMNRYSVQTYVVEKSKALVIDAIQKELARDGQVFYLFNNIEQIYNVARTLQTALPDARVGIVHGKMDRNDIEDTMIRFTNHELDVLVCTTIVENGIDIPNVNTILIDNAQDFGLSQIYQIKGRVGRSDRIAYAYLLVPPRKQLSETAQKRLQAVKEFARLGSGYKIAMRDLTIRGAGDLLGPDQSGFIDTVGIDMYIEMLEEAIESKRTGIPPAQAVPSPRSMVAKTGYIPEGFTANDYDKLEMYQLIDAAETEDELEQYRKDVIDQYGRLPKEVDALFAKKRLEMKLEDPIVMNCREVKGDTEITFTPLYTMRADGMKLFSSISKISKDIGIKYVQGKIVITVPAGKDNIDQTVKAISAAREATKSENR